jgi:hypothetical protein
VLVFACLKEGRRVVWECRGRAVEWLRAKVYGVERKTWGCE